MSAALLRGKDSARLHSDEQALTTRTGNWYRCADHLCYVRLARLHRLQFQQRLADFLSFGDVEAPLLRSSKRAWDIKHRLRVARLHMPAESSCAAEQETMFGLQEAVPVLLERHSLARLTQALSV